MGFIYFLSQQNKHKIDFLAVSGFSGWVWVFWTDRASAGVSNSVTKIKKLSTTTTKIACFTTLFICFTERTKIIIEIKSAVSEVKAFQGF